MVRGTLGYGSITCFFLACQKLPIADATTFTFLGPLIVALLSPCILKERLTAATAVVIPLCIAGVILITQPGFIFGEGTKQLPVLGLLIGLGQPFFSAGAKVCFALRCCT
jgi:drug/metabolite transporter (DMT)-like permease